MKNRILVVDDEPGMRRAIERVLKKQYDLALAAMPSEGMELCREFRPDVAILDIRMPEMDGYELMSRLKEIDPHLDVILMTGSLSDSDEKMIRAIRGKAFYFIQKPFDREVLLALVERCVELHRLSSENRRYLARLESELAQARAFQQSLLPDVPATRHGVKFDARYQPSDELGGDFFDHAAVGDGRVAFLIADVSGHGAAAAMLTGIAKSAFQSLRNRGSEPVAVIERIAEGLSTFDESRFVTIFCARIDANAGVLEYVNAGHPPTLLWNTADGPGPGITRLAKTGPMVMAGLDGVTWRQETREIGAGSRLFLYTDGLLEARGDDDFFGIDRLESVIRAHSTAEASDVLDAVRSSAGDFAGGRPYDDDLTMLQVDMMNPT